MDTTSGSTVALSHGLAGYVHAVAEAVGVPAEGTSFEVSDTVTAYVALTPRLSGRPGRDLMLVWSEHSGWAIAVETRPTESSEVLAHLGGIAPVPPPQVVANFVEEVVAGRWTDQARPAFARNREGLTDLVSSYLEATSE
ncbi:hypothetical protein FKR81_36620 [Lentzea tibetensis]|uniref:DUF6292 domain-containing protein n=1 Tax=Lentzea tibetensis TaxID=2591470 RepID=A0A563EI42_9PSEU|nr:DUF6292 family protein [Lentzea tibetensis]TWP46265.1 hypothetical protein FKR81_36620 [Lentzea tibetensis]